MPFFLNGSIKNSYKNPVSVTLQVRSASDIFAKSGKRVWLSASLTVEAALALSLFLFAAVIMLTPMKMMDTHRRIQASMESFGEDLSQIVYLLYLKKNGDDNSPPDLAAELAVEAYAYGKVMKYVEEGRISSVSFRRSQILEDGETIYLIMDYRMRLPFPVFRIDSFPMRAVTYRRAWIGREGRLGELEESEEDEILVYVGKGSTRFHWSGNCHYLNNQLISCKKEDVGSLRNEYGSRYSPCSVCGKGIAEGGEVFVFPSGTSYHSRQSCTSITAYVRQVPLSEVSYLGACSYCSRNKS